MVTCEKCGGNYDNGELVGGICLECIEEERQREIRENVVCKVLNGSFNQMEMGLV